MALLPPIDEADLLARAKAIAGHPLASLAADAGVDVPENLKRHKGWVGQLLELALGATASTRPEPDFEHLGVELKTIPVDLTGRPRESTYVCKAALDTIGTTDWSTSLVKKKLNRVLWMPVQADETIPLAERRVGNPLLWTPSTEDEAVFAADYEELVQMIEEGWVESVTAHRGQYLQLRPKGASAKARARGVDDDGAPMRTPPKGFYLRSRFTRALLEREYRLP